MQKINTQVHVFQPPGLYVYLVVTPSTESVSYVFTVDLTTGCLFYSATPFVDVFKSHRSACLSIAKRFSETVNSTQIKKWTGKALIGLTYENQHLVIGLIQSSKKVASLPNGSSIKQINQTDFVTIPLKTYNPKNNNPPSFTQFPLNEMHFYCETADLTRPYPSEHSVEDCDNDFCWNQRWRIPFVRIGLENVCIVMLQGFSLTSDLHTDEEITYIVRRSVLNPYTRYTSRGTNQNGAPGNEVECELILNDKNSNFLSNCWRRGSIPIKWSTVVGTVGSAQHIVSPFQDNGTTNYFNSISERFGNIPITIINLLNDSENNLTDAYKKAVDKLQFIDFKTYDIGSMPENFLVETFQSVMRPLAEMTEFTVGHNNIVTSKQKRILRFNCADSTDRTNVATFIYARALVEMRQCDDRANDFLANAFIKAGDVISIMYMSTPAARSGVIRSTVTGISHAKSSDMTLSCVRRFKHIARFDSVSDGVINNWISKDICFTPLYSLDYNDMSIIRNVSMCLQNMNPLDSSIIDYEYTMITASKNTSTELIIQFPMPMILCVLRLMLLPSSAGEIPSSFTLSCGMDNNSKSCYLKDVLLPVVKVPTFAKYSLAHAPRWGVQAPLVQSASELVRFVWITFDRKVDDMKISNVSVDAYIPKIEIKMPTFKCMESNVLEEYEKRIRAFMSKNERNISDLVELEAFRLRSKISLNIRNAIMIRFGVNPAISSIRFFLLRSETNEQICSFCRKSLGNSKVMSFFLHETFKSLLNPLKPQPQHPSSYSLCKECSQQLLMCSSVIKELEGMIEKVDVPSMPKNKWKIEEIDGRVNLSKCKAIFFEYPKEATGCVNDLLKDGNDDFIGNERCCYTRSEDDKISNFIINEKSMNESRNENIVDCDSNIVENNREIEQPKNCYIIDSKNEKQFFFTICFTSASIPDELFIEFDKLLPKSVDIISPLKCQPVMKRNESSISLRFESDILNCISFVITANEDQNSIVMKNVKCMGQFTEKRKGSPQWFTFPIPNFKGNCFPGYWDKITRTQTFTLKSPAILRRVNFMVPCINGTLPQSILLAIYDKRNYLVKSTHILIPQPQPQQGIGTKIEMNYRISDAPAGSVIKLFYLDLIERLKPYDVNFLLMPSTPERGMAQSKLF
ncbi:hypothetical protein TRFO_17064 [Tritrichomonas foetus]|uniref:SAC domain-containing protein n=1 Tax=Tritrichomonas foetus TaxID=1144522 RepID=A0A1J4KP86_9EUKA|nr:hypothetical protein TRFO_17064 [Tritrichomonas foetus]|eukprot:OHT12914.1 hypothetical protein TRFO_17064 [Tritrichomonas foetus]